MKDIPREQLCALVNEIDSLLEAGAEMPWQIKYVWIRMRQILDGSGAPPAPPDRTEEEDILLEPAPDREPFSDALSETQLTVKTLMENLERSADLAKLESWHPDLVFCDDPELWRIYQRRRAELKDQVKNDS